MKNKIPKNFRGVTVRIKDKLYCFPYPDLRLWAILAKKYKNVGYYGGDNK
ncbi:MAG: hypothetical protein IPJ03_16240 [Ignavibacteriales bacterium]|nr:hypothetical protein [Ignavibacteriales bacterium]